MNDPVRQGQGIYPHVDAGERHNEIVYTRQHISLALRIISFSPSLIITILFPASNKKCRDANIQ